jgi:hypothetical protein
MRVLLLGDTHANTGSALAAIDHAAALRADIILQLGDFGYWPNDRQGYSFLRKVEKRLVLRGLNLWWVDGNHENFDQLKRLPLQPDRTQWLRDAMGQFSPVMRHLPRGYRWTWENSTWVAVGGATSVDRQYRTPMVDWFPAEELTDEQAGAIIADGPADVVAAHDTIWNPTSWLGLRMDQTLPPWRRPPEWPVSALVASDTHQRRLRRVVEGVGAQRVFHGHHHIRCSSVLEAPHGPVSIEGLGMDSDPLSERCLLVDGDGLPILGADE